MAGIRFSNWTPLCILKPTFNYGFSEWSEYRDLLLIARKGKLLKNDEMNKVRTGEEEPKETD